MTLSRKPLFTLVLSLALGAACATGTPTRKAEHAKPTARRLAAEVTGAPTAVNAAGFPELGTDRNGELMSAIQKSLKKLARGMPADDLKATAEKLRHYLLFLGLNAKDFKRAERAAAAEAAAGEPAPAVVVPVVRAAASPVPADPDAEDEDADKTPSNLKAIQRLFNASTQFLDCEDLTNWECLEKSPKLKPGAKYRQEPSPDLGAPVRAGASLDMDVFFTQAWDGSPRSGVVDRLAERLNTDATKSLSVAMYGINDIGGSMKPVYDSISSLARNPALSVRAVVDVSGIERSPAPWIFGYTSPGVELEKRWLFAPGAGGNGMHATFQYDATPGFIREMNASITSPEQARARVEWPSSHIMHNKFAVLENVEGKKAVWSGTANLSDHCMGAETNSNMSIYIRNDQVAQAFLDEFNHMFNFDPAVPVKSRLVSGPVPNQPFPVGRFHHNKFPVSKRLFLFDDGTKVRVHFAPTDDAEHRVILPMLLSANAGDEIRISMFGGTGYEIVRALQYATARGANVRIVFDRRLGHGLTSWIRDSVMNVFMPNPYLGKVAQAGVTPGKIDVRVSSWEGKNHYKAGTLTRRLADGSTFAETLIVGSQNWSGGGNDHNDENLVSIQNVSLEVDAAKKFNQEFDTRLWPASREERPRAGSQALENLH